MNHLQDHHYRHHLVVPKWYKLLITGQIIVHSNAKQRRKVLIIFLLILQTSIMVEMLSNGCETEIKHAGPKMNPKTQATKPNKTELTTV